MENLSVQANSINKTYQYGVDLYTRWCKENGKELIVDNEVQVKDFLVEHRKGWPTGNPKTLPTIKMRFQAIRKLYKNNGSDVDFSAISKKLSSLQ